MARMLPGPLVSAQWVADHLGADDLLVVDASVVAYTQPNGRPGMLSGHELYLADGHIPGAVFADLLEEFSDPAGRHPFTRPDHERFAAAAGDLGIGAGTTVVVYDTALGQWASRLWWLLRSFGHDAAAVLDGGLTAWRALGAPLDRGHVAPTPTVFTPVERGDAWVDKEFVERVVHGNEEAALVCSAPPATADRVIPGSQSLPVARLVDRETRVARPDDELRALFAPLRAASRVVAYCQGGIAATATALHLVRLGEERVAVYDGSLAEWAEDADAPLEALSRSR